MPSPEVDYGRPQCAKSLNAWARKLTGKDGWSPTTNVIGLVEGDPRLASKYRQQYGRTPQLESGKPDGLFCLGGLAYAVEVKGFAGGSLDFSILRPEQRRWAESMCWPYYIFLWGYPDKLPPDFRSKEAQEKRIAWFVPIETWLETEQRVYDIARVGTIHLDAFTRTSLREAGLNLRSAFYDYELEYREGAWWPLRGPMRIRLD